MKGRLHASVLLTAAMLVFGCSSKLAPPGHFQDRPIVIDGNMNDWNFPLRFSNPAYNMEYEVSNLSFPIPYKLTLRYSKIFDSKDRYDEKRHI